jgi:uncharacterized damage-inducible protein DinB
MIAYGGRELAKAFRTVRANTVQIAEDIPEDRYDFEAAPDTHSVRVLLNHIAFSPMMYENMHREQRVTTLKGYDFGAAIGRAAAREREPRTKAQVVDLLKSEGERLAVWLESLSPEFLGETFTDPTGGNPRTRFESLLGVKEHEMHHRGQLMLIERMLGIVPHLTRQRQQRAASHQPAPATATA